MQNSQIINRMQPTKDNNLIVVFSAPIRTIFNTILIFFFMIFGLTQCTQAPKEQPEKTISYADFQEKAEQALDKALETKKQELIEYLNMAGEKAASVKGDQLFLNFFRSKLAFNQIRNQNSLPTELREKANALDKAVNDHFLVNYERFYDILMIDTSGYIFYTVRKEKDWQQNIFAASFENSTLSGKLKEQQSFIDFSFYEISQNPSAFFIEPIKHDGEFLGWIVLQFSVSNINNIFSPIDALGSTGEVILVNQDHYMLTDSRFVPQSTILTKQLSNENIHAKFTMEQGHKQVIDYRGFSVLSSFETFTFQNSKWLVISKINEAEIKTNYYKKYPNKLKTTLQLSERNILPTQQPAKKEEDIIIVKMDEYQRSTDQTIGTFGISKCTGVLLTLPEKFSYFAHISPYDKVYENSKTDVLSHLLSKIKFLDITRSEQQLMEITIIAPHTKTVENITKILINEGFFINQIYVAQNHNATFANVFHSPKLNETTIQWVGKDTLYETISSKTLKNLNDYSVLPNE
ncbi:MAG: cache domain-containing protein [Salinivirgaceae bacterium]